MRELRNHGGDVLDRVARGESLVVTRDGAQVAGLRPSGRRPPTTAELIARRSTLPDVDPHLLRRDIDSVIDAAI